jgi:hypothetical protein
MGKGTMIYGRLHAKYPIIDALPNNLKNFSNFETGFEGQKPKRSGHGGIGVPAGADEAPCGVIAGGRNPACRSNPHPLSLKIESRR